MDFYLYNFQLIESANIIKTLLMLIADTKPKVLHLKPKHYQLLCNHGIQLNYSKEYFTSVECIVVHGNSNLPKDHKQKSYTLFPNLNTYRFLDNEYYEANESNDMNLPDSHDIVKMKTPDVDLSATVFRPM